MARLRSAPLLIVVLVIAAFGRLLFADFTWWDDQETVHHNALLNPPTLEALGYYWAHFVQGLYVPVTFTAWAGLARIAYIGTPDGFGIYLNPTVFHLANLLVHIASCLLVLAILRRLLRDEVASLLGTLLFALHPVQVETVAWVSGLKDLLCWCFSLATTLCFLRGIERAGATGRSVWRGSPMPLALAFLVLGILSKPTAMVVPPILLMIDGLLLRRCWARSLLNLLPLFAVALAGAAIARVAQFVEHVPAPSVWRRPFVAGDALAFYLAKIVWPATLAVDYGRMPSVVLASSWAYVVWLIPAALVVLLLATRRQWPVPAAAGAIALFSVAPVLGLTPFQMQSYSTVTDHYLYFAMLGPALAMGWAIREWPGSLTRAIAIAIVVALGCRTALQTRVWHDSFTLFGHAIATNERSFASHWNLACVYTLTIPPQPELAEPEADKAIAIAPDNFFVLDGYASTKFMLGKRTEALAAWRKACQLAEAAGPRGRRAHVKTATGVARHLLDVGEPDQALAWAREAFDADPTDPTTKSLLADVRKAIAAKPATVPAIVPATAASPTTAPALPAASGPG